MPRSVFGRNSLVAWWAAGIIGWSAAGVADDCVPPTVMPIRVKTLDPLPEDPCTDPPPPVRWRRVEPRARSGNWIISPSPTPTFSGGPKQLEVPGLAERTLCNNSILVTGAFHKDGAAGANDVDGIALAILGPMNVTVCQADPTLILTMTYYFAHGSNSSAQDHLKISVDGAAGHVFREVGCSRNVNAVWRTVSVPLGTASQVLRDGKIRLRVEAADRGPNSLVEAAIRDLTITGSTASP